MSDEASPELPSMYDLIIERPLYSKVENVTAQFLTELRYRRIQFDAYCVNCKKDGTFKPYGRSYVGVDAHPDSADKSLFTIQVACQRCNAVYHSEFYLNKTTLTKYGQIPAIVEIVSGDITRYRDVLDKRYFSELTRANGLISHGVGIGAFVYLRRIFEHLIDEHRAFVEKSGTLIDTSMDFGLKTKFKRLKTFFLQPWSRTEPCTKF